MNGKLPKIRDANVQLKLGKLKLNSAPGAEKKPSSPERFSSAGTSKSLNQMQDVTSLVSSTKSAPSSRKYSLIDDITALRKQNCKSILNFKFNNYRTLILSECRQIRGDSKGILYWMSREQRLQDNWSLLYAQKLALENKMPLYVCFCLVPSFLNASFRTYHFMLEGLKEVQQELNDLKIPFHILVGEAREQIPNLVDQNNLGAVVCDFSPMRISLSWVEELKKSLPKTVLFSQVDGRNVVPCWYASSKLENGAFSIRPKLTAKLDEFLTEFPPVIAQQEANVTTLNMKNLKHFENVADCYSILTCDKSVKQVDWARPGYRAGIEALQDFIDDPQRLSVYDMARNDPNGRAQSSLSPWLHFGQISAQRCALEARKYLAEHAEAVEWFLDALVIRRELSDNYCYYEKNYDNMNGAPAWGRETLMKHSADKRPYLYTLEQFEKAKTHDSLWNACQIQLLLDGKIHGYMRMYWSKKILEWCERPDRALEICIYLNDKYSLDGRDPNGYVGAQSSMTGLHDKSFPDQDVFGRVRGMTNKGCRQKFDVEKFVERSMKRRSEILS